VQTVIQPFQGPVVVAVGLALHLQTAETAGPGELLAVAAVVVVRAKTPEERGPEERVAAAKSVFIHGDV